MSLRRSYVTAGLGPHGQPRAWGSRAHVGFCSPTGLYCSGRAVSARAGLAPRQGACVCARARVVCVRAPVLAQLASHLVGRTEPVPGTASHNRGEGPGRSALESRQR